MRAAVQGSAATLDNQSSRFGGERRPQVITERKRMSVMCMLGGATPDEQGSEANVRSSAATLDNQSTEANVRSSAATLDNQSNMSLVARKSVAEVLLWTTKVARAASEFQ